ncbi:hypothetical protein [Sorangium sp. So ce204]|uniref:hypothetical protein n=1 Tax=Sorangium sp. So ce204 TaxID=3133288 RepID=UPI003F5E9061
MCVFAMTQIGCGEDEVTTQISGKAVATFVSRVAGVPEVDKVFVMDTGNTGSTTVKSGDNWGIRCRAGGDMAPWFELVNEQTVSGTPPDQLLSSEFNAIFLKESDGVVQDPPQEANVVVMLEGYTYSGICEVMFTKTNDRPYEADVYSAICRDLRASDGLPARLESADFHITCCQDDC